MPTLIMAIHRLQAGLEPIDPRDDLGYGANYLWMLTGEDFDAERGRAVEQYQITTIDHGFNASTFTARVICSSGARSEEHPSELQSLMRISYAVFCFNKKY